MYEAEQSEKEQESEEENQENQENQSKVEDSMKVEDTRQKWVDRAPSGGSLRHRIATASTASEDAIADDRTTGEKSTQESAQVEANNSMEAWKQRMEEKAKSMHLGTGNRGRVKGRRMMRTLPRTWGKKAAAAKQDGEKQEVEAESESPGVKKRNLLDRAKSGGTLRFGPNSKMPVGDGKQDKDDKDGAEPEPTEKGSSVAMNNWKQTMEQKVEDLNAKPGAGGLRARRRQRKIMPRTWGKAAKDAQASSSKPHKEDSVESETPSAETSASTLASPTKEGIPQTEITSETEENVAQITYGSMSQ